MKKQAKKTTTRKAASQKSAAPLLTVGNIVLIRTAVYHALGRVQALFTVEGVGFVQIAEASYIGDTGRYHEATSRRLAEIANAEIEPVGGAGLMDIQVAAICDVAITVATEKTVK